MIHAPSASRIWIVSGVTDMRKGFDSLSTLVQHQLNESPYSGDLYIFRGRRGDKIKILWYSGDGLVLYYKRLSTGIFTWPQVKDGTVLLSGAQLSMLLEGIDWRKPHRTTPAPHDPDRSHPTMT
jgi:transposase